MRPLKFFWRSLLFITAFACAGRAGYSQSVDTVVEVPTTAHRSALIEIPTAQNPTASSDNSIPMAGEYKSTKNVVEQEKPVFWSWYTDVGYWSEYNFRGTNLTPNSDGAIFGNVRVTKWNFTLGLFGIHQLRMLTVGLSAKVEGQEQPVQEVQRVQEIVRRWLPIRDFLRLFSVNSMS
jgi:hypothetical protein